MAEHTQGPWNAPLLYGETTGLIWAGEPYGGVIANVLQLAKKDFGTTTANAQLIAAAPEMLEALETAAEYFVSFPDLLDDKQLPIAEEIFAALVKARGEK